MLAIACVAGGSCAQVPPEDKAQPDSNRAEAEIRGALELTGSVERGEQVYQVCSNCHLPSGMGIPDGTMPQLAGQHGSVLIKQIADIRTGLRENPIMYPYTVELDAPQKLADLAAYLQSLPVPTSNGKGPGLRLERGRQIYEESCASCHGERGQGSAEAFCPVLAGQHYKYLMRQITDIRDGRRPHADPAMAQVVDEFDDRDLSATVDYISRLRGSPGDPDD